MIIYFKFNKHWKFDQIRDFSPKQSYYYLIFLLFLYYTYLCIYMYVFLRTMGNAGVDINVIYDIRYVHFTCSDFFKLT